MDIFLKTLENPVGLVFVVIALGLLVGQIPFGPVRLGGSGVLVAGLFFGHFGFELPKVLQTVGVVLFVYSVGLRAGPYFINAIKKSKATFFVMAFVIAGSGGLLAVILKKVFNLPADIITGLYAGAMTSTPALAAAVETLGSSSPSLGYGVAYPLGILFVILSVQILPGLFRVHLSKEEEVYEKSIIKRGIVRQAFEITNDNVVGHPISDLADVAKIHFRIVRIKRGEEIFTPYSDDRLLKLDKVLAVGDQEELYRLRIILGKSIEVNEVPYSEGAASRWVTISSKKFVGRKIGQLEIGHLYGIIVTRIKRGGIEFAPAVDFTLEAGDEVRVSGTPEDIQRFVLLVVRDQESMYQTDIFSFAIGLAFGVLLGFIRIPLPNQLFLSFGVAGGPLIVGLVFGHIGRFGRLVGHMPKAAKIITGELGLYLFLAVAGCSAGGNFISVIHEQGTLLVFCGALMTVTPIVVAAMVGRVLFKTNFLILLGMICGGMTSTPALGVLSTNTKSDIPALGYTGIYPLAVLLTTLVAQIIASF